MDLEQQGAPRAVLAAIDTGEYDIDASLDELSALCESAGAEVVAALVQQRSRPDPASYLGSGKLEEAKELCERLDADLLVVDAELSGARLRNIERVVDVAVVDRTTLILDIFANRAVTAEGKLQVELAQLKYRLPRLAGTTGNVLSRLGGGIGTRGPGETKLETDRRLIRRRIATLETKLEELEKRRALTRRRREKTGIPVVSLVGYTNVGKSSILNALTGADVLAQDKLFATLDPTVRRLSVGDLQQVLVVDTVGFVSRLPHNLVDAFHSTLEEITNSDLIVRVADASAADWARQLEVTQQTLEQLGCADIEQMTLFNKCDLIDTAAALPGLAVSAKTGEGIEAFIAEISRRLADRVVRFTVLLPFDKIGLSAVIREKGNVLSEEYTDEGLLLKATVDRSIFSRFEQYVVDI